jgi:glycosyltransferase involved in cell wall biosynthesis
MEPQKGLAYLIEAFRQLRCSGRPGRLWLVGDGPLRRDLETAVRDAGLAESVDFLGPRSDVPALLRRMDVVVLPSLWEGLPNAMIEAMAAARCTVATAVDGTPEVVLGGETGLLVPPRDPQAIEKAMARLLDDEPLRRRMGAAGRLRVEKRFRMERMVEETESVYRELIAS